MKNYVLILTLLLSIASSVNAKQLYQCGAVNKEDAGACVVGKTVRIYHPAAELQGFHVEAKFGLLEEVDPNGNIVQSIKLGTQDKHFYSSALHNYGDSVSVTFSNWLNSRWQNAAGSVVRQTIVSGVKATDTVETDVPFLKFSLEIRNWHWKSANPDSHVRFTSEYSLKQNSSRLKDAATVRDLTFEDLGMGDSVSSGGAYKTVGTIKNGTLAVSIEFPHFTRSLFHDWEL